MSWWSKELQNMKREVASKKRRIRNAATIRRVKVISEYLHTKEEYEKEVNEAQIESWKSFCRRRDRESVCEGNYRVIKGTNNRHEDLPIIKDGKQADREESAKNVAKTFYPRDDT